MITNYYSGGVSCDELKALNVTYPAGYYAFTAESNKGYTWEGQVYFSEGSCDDWSYAGRIPGKWKFEC